MQFGAHRVSISKVFAAAFFHGHARVESSHASPASTLWFVKVVCTLCIRHSQSLTLFSTDYFRENLNPFVAYSVVYHLNNRLNNPDLAFSFFRYSKLCLNLIHLESTCHLLLSSLCRMGFHDSAKLVYEYMKADGFMPNSLELKNVVSCFANAGEFKTAEEILIAKAEICNARKERISSFVYNNFLKTLMNRNPVDEGVIFFRSHILRLKSFSPDTCSFNIVMRGLCHVGRVEDAFEFFDVMRNFGCDPDLVTYNTLIDGLCKAGRVDRAEELLREVKPQSSLSPDVVTYTSLICGYCKSHKMDDAAALFDEMINNGIRPSLTTFNAMINGFGKKGELSSALMIYERMKGGGFHPDVITFTSLIDAHCRLGELEHGLNLWDEMNGRKVLPNKFTFSILISALCKENRLNEARYLLSQWNWRQDDVPRPHIYNPVIDGFCKAGNVDEANVIVAEMEAKGCIHDKMTFTSLILGHCMKGRMFEAIGIYQKMLALGCVPDNITISSLTSCLRKAGMAREANEIEQNASNNMRSGSSSLERTPSISNNMTVTVAV